MNHNHIFAVGAFLLASTAVNAEDLNTQITVRHEVVPEERAASRLSIFPAISLPAVNPGRLPAATDATASKLTPFIRTLEPAAYATTPTPWPWRGYAVAGYGPTYNLAASAGYKFIDRQDLSAKAFMQFDGLKYTSKHPDKPYRVYGPVTLRNNSVAAGADVAWQPFHGASFNANVLYGFSDYNVPVPVLNMGKPFDDPADCRVDHYGINANMLKVNASWHHQTSRKFSYTFKAGYGLIRFGKIFEAVTENIGDLSLALNYDYGSVSHWNMRVSAQLINDSANGVAGAYNKGIISIYPSYLMTLKRFTLKAGVKIDSYTGNIDSADGYNGFIYPELLLDWHPSDFFNLYGKMEGRTDSNSFMSLYEAQPYNYPTMGGSYGLLGNLYGCSQIYSFEAGFGLGPWKGAGLQFFVGLDAANNWLTPAVKAGYWQSADVTGAHFGAKASYAYRSYLDISIKAIYATAPDNDFKTGYYLWRDHARWDLSAKAIVRPIEPLAITLSYHLRTGRAKPMPDFMSQPLGNISDLNASASYRINNQWSVFINGENLINHRYYLGPAIPSQGIRGMIGATYLF